MRSVRIPRNPWDITLADGVALEDGVILLSTGRRRGRARIEINKNVYVNRYTFIDASEYISIGANTLIGPFCYITDHDHDVGATCPGATAIDGIISAPTNIGSNVWIGAHCSILKGITIGDGAIVGAGSVVTKDVAPNSVVAGVPARPIRTTLQTGLGTAK